MSVASCEPRDPRAHGPAQHERENELRGMSVHHPRCFQAWPGPCSGCSFKSAFPLLSADYRAPLVISHGSLTKYDDRHSRGGSIQGNQSSFENEHDRGREIHKGK